MMFCKKSMIPPFPFTREYQFYYNLSTIIARLRKIKQLDIVLQKMAERRAKNRRLTVLFEGVKNSVYYGYAPNFIRVGVKSKDNLTKKIKTIIIN